MKGVIFGAPFSSEESSLHDLVLNKFNILEKILDWCIFLFLHCGATLA